MLRPWLIMLAVVAVPALAGATGLEPDNQELIGEGIEIYRQHSASCHGAKLEGEPNWRSPKETGRMPAPPHDETGHTWHHSDKILFDLTKFGLKKFAGEDYESDMPAYDGTLSDREITAVLSYIKSTWPADIREHHDRLNKR